MANRHKPLHDALADQEPLVVHLHERRCAVLQPTDEGLTLTYEPAYLETPGVLALSLRLPMRPEPYPTTIAQAWLDGLLPEGPRRQAVGTRWNIPYRSTYAVLAAIGAGMRRRRRDRVHRPRPDATTHPSRRRIDHGRASRRTPDDRARPRDGGAAQPRRHATQALPSPGRGPLAMAHPVAPEHTHPQTRKREPGKPRTSSRTSTP